MVTLTQGVPWDGTSSGRNREEADSDEGVPPDAELAPDDALTWDTADVHWPGVAEPLARTRAPGPPGAPGAQGSPDRISGPRSLPTR